MNNPKVEFSIGQPVELKLLTDEPITGTSQYGHWNLYPVLNQNEIQSFFAPQSVVDLMKKKGLGKNAVISVTKHITKKDKKMITDYSIDVVSAKAVETSVEKNGTTKRNKNKAGNDNNPEFIQLRDAIKSAVDYKKLLGIKNLDVSQLGIALFNKRVIAEMPF